MKGVQSLSTADLLALMSELLVPMASVERTIKLPFDLERWENDAEHSYFLATLGCALAHQLDPELDLGRVSHYALVHDLVEVHAGDTTIWAEQQWLSSKSEREARALKRIQKRFGAVFPWVIETIHAYEKLDEPESCYVYALDKILPHAIITIADHQPLLPTFSAYKEKERVARGKIARYPKLLPFFDELCKMYVATPHFFVSEVADTTS
jgi:5'-deoxynucleotidase YfbR-like HD superfamily hydrolase